MKIVALIAAIALLIAAFSQAGEPIFPMSSYVEQKKPTQTPIVHENYSAYQPWYVNGGNTPDSHLINDHGVNPANLAGLSQDEKNRLHGKMHGEKAVVSRIIPSVTKQVYSPQIQTQSRCPGGVCPIPQVRRR